MFKSNRDFKLYLEDVLIHHYFGVADKVLWDTLDEEFNEFENTVNLILKKLK